MTERVGKGTLLCERYLLGDEVGRAGRWRVFRASDRETGETLGVVVPGARPDSEARRHLEADEDEKAARAIVAVEIYGLKVTTKLILLAWLTFGPGLKGYVSRRKPTGPAPPPRDENFPSSVRRALLRAAEYRCARCGSEEDLEVDHVVPVFAGGEGVYENGQVLCRVCHREKTDADRLEHGC